MLQEKTTVCTSCFGVRKNTKWIHTALYFHFKGIFLYMKLWRYVSCKFAPVKSYHEWSTWMCFSVWSPTNLSITNLLSLRHLLLFTSLDPLFFVSITINHFKLNWIKLNHGQNVRFHDALHLFWESGNWIETLLLNRYTFNTNSCCFPFDKCGEFILISLDTRHPAQYNRLWKHIFFG